MATPRTIKPGIKQLTIKPEDSLLNVSAAAKPLVLASTKVLGAMAVTISIRETPAIGFVLQNCKTAVAASTGPLKDGVDEFALFAYEDSLVSFL